MDSWIIVFWSAAALSVWVYIGYSLLMAAIAGSKKQDERVNAPLPSVTLIIPAHNEEVVIEDKLRNTLEIDYPAEKLQVLVASDGSSDRTVEIARQFESDRVTLLPFPQQRGKASALNDAIEVATGDVLCLCDANVMFQPMALKQLVSRMAEPGIGAVSGKVCLASHESNFGEGESLYYQFERRLQLGESRLGSVMGVDGGMYVVKRNLFRPLAPDTILDDFVVAMRVIRQGQKVVYEPAAVANENGTPRATQEYRRRVRVAAGGVQVLKRGEFPPLLRPLEFFQFVSHKFLRWTSPFVLAALFVSNVFLWNRGRFFQAVLILQLLFYAMAAVATVSLSIRRTRIGGIPFYFTMSHIAMLEGLIRGLFNRQKVTWKQAERKAVTTTTETSSEASAT